MHFQSVLIAWLAMPGPAIRRPRAASLAGVTVCGKVAEGQLVQAHPQSNNRCISKKFHLLILAHISTRKWWDPCSISEAIFGKNGAIV